MQRAGVWRPLVELHVTGRLCDSAQPRAVRAGERHIQLGAFVERKVGLTKEGCGDRHGPSDTCRVCLPVDGRRIPLTRRSIVTTRRIHGGGGGGGAIGVGKGGHQWQILQ